MHLLVSEGIHVPYDLSGHLASVSGAVLKGSLNNGHNEGQGRGVNEVDELCVQQRLQARLGPFGGISQSVQQDGSDGWEENKVVKIAYLQK